MTHILTNEDMMMKAPSIFAVEHFEQMSERYKFIPTIQVIDALRDAGFQPISADQCKTRKPGKAEYTKHMVKFRHPELQSNGLEIPEVVLINSHDGTSAYQLLCGIFRIACSNGLIVQSQDMGSISVRHSGANDLCDQVIAASQQIIDEVPSVFKKVEDWKTIDMSPDEQGIYAMAAAELRGMPAENFDTRRLLIARRYEDKTSDLWTTFNRVQENVIKGGVQGRNSNNRRVRTRPIKAVNENVKLNKALWILTEGFENLKKQQAA